MTRLLTAIILIALALATLWVLSRWGDPKPTLVDATPADVSECAPVQLPNPCNTTTDCDRIDPRSLT